MIKQNKDPEFKLNDSLKEKEIIEKDKEKFINFLNYLIACHESVIKYANWHSFKAYQDAFENLVENWTHISPKEEE